MPDNISEHIERTSTDKFVQAVENVEWAEIGEIVERLDAIPNFWENVMTLEQLRDTWKRTFVRRKIKQIKVDGIPLFASVETTNESGETVRVYKREDKFVPEDFQKAANYYGNQTVYNAKMAVHYADGFENVTGKKMILPFDPECLID